jgi:hypothetical protein
VTTLRAAEKFPPEYISSETVSPLIDGAKAFYIEGYFLTHGTNVVVELGKKAASAGKVCPIAQNLLKSPPNSTQGLFVKHFGALYSPVFR